MFSRSRTALGLLVVVMAVVALGAGTGAATGPPRGAPAGKSKTTIHGVNFQVRTFADTNYCMQAESGTLPGRTITLQQCAVADNQRWALALNKGQTNLILDSQGMCLDGVFHAGDEGLARAVNACRFTDDWRFVYRSDSLIQDVGNGKCLAVPGAAANAAVSLADCDSTKPGQRWLITH